MTRELTLADFSSRVGRAFEVEAGDERVTMTLDRFQKLPGGIRKGGSFRLEYLGPAEPILPQSTYPMSEGEDRFEMFIVPVASEPAGIRYEAIFF